MRAKNWFHDKGKTVFCWYRMSRKVVAWKKHLFSVLEECSDDCERNKKNNTTQNKSYARILKFGTKVLRNTRLQ